MFGTAALLGAGITAFYMTRLFFMTFFGERRWTDDVHPHESPLVMTVPADGARRRLGRARPGARPDRGIQDWLEPVVGEPPRRAPVLPVRGASLTLTLVLVAAGVGLAWSMYLRQPGARRRPGRARSLTRAARQDLYQDAVNEAVFMRPGQYLTRSLVFFDNRGVDGAVNGLAALIGGTSGRLRRLQTGFVRSYALSMFAGAAVVVGALLLVRL